MAKTLETTFVVPYLIDLEPANIQRGPLNQFQAKRANKTETWELIRTLNRRLENPLPDSQIERTFTRWWPDLEIELNNLSEVENKQEPRRSLEDMRSETLELVRSLSRSRVVEGIDNFHPLSSILANLSSSILANLSTDIAKSLIIRSTDDNDGFKSEIKKLILPEPKK